MSSESRTEATKPVSGGMDLRLMALSKLSDQSKNTFWVQLVVAGVMLIGMAFYLYQALEQGAWQIYTLASLTGFLAIVSLVGAFWARRGGANQAVWMVLVSLQVVIAICPLFVSNVGLGCAVFVIVTTLIVTTLCITPARSRLLNLLGVGAGLVALLIDGFVTNLQVSVSLFFEVFIIAGAITAVLVYLLILFGYFPTYGLRTKLTITVIGVVVLSIGMLAGVNNISARRALIDAADKTLLLAASETAEDIDEYFTELMNRFSIQAATPLLKIFFTLTPDERAINPTAQTFLFAQSILTGAQYYAVLDRQGTVLLHTEEEDAGLLPTYLGLPPGVQSSLLQSMSSGAVYISPVLFPPESDIPFYVMGAQITSEANTPVGILVASFSLDTLQGIVTAANDTADIGSYAVLLDENHLRIVHGRDPETQYRLLVAPDRPQYGSLVDSWRIPETVNYEDVATNYPDFELGLNAVDESPFFSTEDSAGGGAVHLAAATRLVNRPWILAFLQSQERILEPVGAQTRTNILLAVGVTGLGILVAALLARLLADPIINLTSIAERAAGGNLYLQAATQSPDEIGALGSAFNIMINQLRQTLEGLETRVAERTAELAQTSAQMEYRADRLQTVAEVAHAIAAVQDPAELLPRVTEEISKRYGYYHVGVFLLDPEQTYALLQATNSAGGKRMLARNHRLRVGEVGIVGYVAGTGQARIALDVGKDAVFFNNPDLPDTRSEIALPLKAGQDVIGVLDVQSVEPGAFSQDDIALLSALADQVATAIQNARLYDETRRTLRELQITQRQYLQDVWGKQLTERHTPGFEVAYGQISPLQDQDISKVEPIVSAPVEGSGTEADRMGMNNNGKLVIPIGLRGHVIGVIDLQEAEPGRSWSKEELELARAVADQVGLALENARLFEETQRRAERERMVTDITTKIRATNDPQSILDTALAELRNALRVKSVQVRMSSGESAQSRDREPEARSSGGSSQVEGGKV